MKMLKKILPMIAMCASLSYSQFSTVTDHTDAGGNVIHQSFNVVISLYRSVSATERSNYEELINHWADALYEASNGSQSLGTVRIFQDGKQGDIADILWNADEHPRAMPGGFHSRAGTIMVGDAWGGDDVIGNSVMRNIIGYTLAHEWGHYCYSLFDQYEGDVAYTESYMPQPGDTESDPSLMADQHNALGYGANTTLTGKPGNWEYLNFDTQDRYISNNAQGRFWGLSCWGVLSSPDGLSQADLSVTVPRRYYEVLGNAAPTASDTWTNPNNGTVHNFMDIQMPTTAGLANLDIIWMTEDIETEVIIDNSGSMGVTVNSRIPMSDVKNAAKWLVDAMKNGETVAGITKYNTTPENVYDLTIIPDPDAGQKDNLKNAVDAITTTGATALFDAAIFGLNKLKNYKSTNGTNALQVAMLLTDGKENASSSTRDEVISQYQSADVALHTFGYGNEVDHESLKELANQTGGSYHKNLETANEVSDAFMNVYAKAAGIPASANSDFPINSGYVFSVDRSQTEFIIDLDYTLEDSVAQCQFVLKDGAGNTIPISSDNITIKGRIDGVFPSNERATILIDNSQVQTLNRGDWTVEVLANGAVKNNAHITVRAFTEGRTYDLFLSNIGGSEIVYPAPMLLIAKVTKGTPLTNVSVDASLTAPSGTTYHITMYDDGSNGDKTSGDGLYSAIFTNYNENGEYSFDVKVSNPNQQARKVILDPSAIRPNISGQQVPTPPILTVTEKFSRVRTLDLIVTGVVSDDHSNTITNATPFDGNNEKVAVKFEAAGDVDCFKLTNFSKDVDLSIRITEMFNVSPVISVYAQDGVTILAEKYLSTDSNEKGYLFVSIPKEQLNDELYIIIRDENSQVAGGIFSLSAGKVKYTDVAVWIQPEGAHDCYNEGDIINYQGAVYQSSINGNVWAPSLAPNFWKLLAGGRYPSYWKAPIGSHDSYNKNAQTIYNGVVYESTIDGNVWAPAPNAVGWIVVQ